jgi:ubiquinone/menaquinone biosynthesis C-methylase UbiE
VLRMATSRFKAFEAERWTAKAQSYDLVTGRVTHRLVEPLLDAAQVGPGIRMLDVASGPGHLAGAAATRGAQVTGVDLADPMVEIASQLYPEVTFRRGDAEALPFPDQEVDAVTGAFVLICLIRRPPFARSPACSGRAVVPRSRYGGLHRDRAW